jgi:hypothetical protein
LILSIHPDWLILSIPSDWSILSIPSDWFILSIVIVFQMIASLKCLFAELLADIGFIQTKMTSRQLERLSPRTGDGVLNGTGPLVRPV